MAINHSNIIEALTDACDNPVQGSFIFDFLGAYGLPKSTITRLRNGGDSRNIGQGSDIGLKKQVYYRYVEPGADVGAEAVELKASEVVARHAVRFVIATDFSTLVAFDLKTDERLEVDLSELDKQYSFFLPLAGYEKAIVHSEHPADVKASEKMGQLFDLIRERNAASTNEQAHALNVFLTRLLFCFYAEDTGIFANGQMSSAIQSTTAKDGSDLDDFFVDMFSVLNLPGDDPQRKAMPEHMRQFPYVNGGLFRDALPVPEFGQKSRRILLECGMLDWSVINPDIFGSMFQAVIDQDQRGNLGQHYTSVSNIMKVIQPLFLDGLYEEFQRSRNNDKRLKALLIRLQNIRIADFACGSGNFLIIAYKELRTLEMSVIDALSALGKQSEIYYSGIRLSQFYGIEIDDFAHEIAILSLWLAEHQMNSAFKRKFGYAEPALPLRESGNIVCGNALHIDWEDVCPATDESGVEAEIYVCGNPPFLGSGGRSDQQNADMAEVFADFKSFGMLDFVASWFWKGAQYIAGKKAEIALVTTNSICQGEQVSMLWPRILELDVKIRFAYQTFSWKNNAKQNAGVHVAIIGLSNADCVKRKELYKTINKEIHKTIPTNINPYLLEGSDSVVTSRSRPLSRSPLMFKGNQPTDGGHLLLTTDEKNALISQEPSAEKWIRRLLGAQEFIQSKERWCLWLKGASNEEIDSLPLVKRRIDKVKEMRMSSKKLPTQALASVPHLFGEIRHPSDGEYILVPSVSSERRSYVPMGFFNAKVITTNLNLMIPNATLYEFGILTSEMHNDWMRAVAGRLENRYRYSATLVYNNFPWPNASAEKRKLIEELAEEVLLIREDYPDKTLADLYDPAKMPQPLLLAHKALDRAVERLYRDRPFRDASERLEHLFARYEKLIELEKSTKSKSARAGSK